MNEKDLEQIEKLLTRKLGQQAAVFDTKLDALAESLSEDIQQSERRLERMMGVLEKKVDLVIENQQALVERTDRSERANAEAHRVFDLRVSNVAADLAAHKADPDAHSRGYQVREAGAMFDSSEPELVEAKQGED